MEMPFTWRGGLLAGGASLTCSPWSCLGVGRSLPLTEGLFSPQPTPSCVEVGSLGAGLAACLATYWEASWGCVPPLPGLSAPTCWLPKMGAWLSSEPRSVPQAGGLGPEAWACLPGQGLRYLEHLCLVLEQMARLQQLCLQLQTQRPPQVSEPQGGQASGGQVWGRQRRARTPGTSP